ncbi:MAG: hypothetical protein RR598_11370 [Anaerorhabdus sp.]|jgi:hypothetical protein
MDTKFEDLGFAIEFLRNGEYNGYVQNFKFKFNAKNRDAQQIGYTRLQSPTIKTNRDSYIYDDIPDAEMILKILEANQSGGRICKVVKITKEGKERIEISPIE